jgi:hypothetical protein
MFKFIKERIIGIRCKQYLLNEVYIPPRQGIIGIIVAIKWLGIKDWIRCSIVRKTVTDEAEVFEWKSGN